MQLLILLKKDLKTLFKQKAVIFTLLIPMFLIIGLGLLPTIIGIDKPLEVGYLNEDQGIEGLNLGNVIIDELSSTFEENHNIELVKLEGQEDFKIAENAIWFPSNFTEIANLTRTATYFTKISDADLRASSVMNSVVESEVEKIVVESLLSTTLPEVDSERIYLDQKDQKTQSRAQIAFPLAYMSFLILILSSSSMRVTGFSAEREAGMMELLLSSVIKRKELVLSKLITGVTYGLSSVMSYIIGIIIVFLIQGASTPREEIAFLILPPELLTPLNIGVIFLLFADLSFLSIQILLGAQLVLGREAGDRLGSMALMILSFLFYFSTIGDPLSESSGRLINPFFWPFRITLNLIFGVDLTKTLLYLVLNLGFSWYLLKLKTRAIEREHVLFE